MEINYAVRRRDGTCALYDGRSARTAGFRLAWVQAFVVIEILSQDGARMRLRWHVRRNALQRVNHSVTTRINEG